MKRLITFLLLIVASGSFARVYSDGIPVEILLRSPLLEKCQLSPDGGTLGFLSPHEGYMNLHVIDLSTGAKTALTREREDLTDFLWASDGRLLCSTSPTQTGPLDNRFKGGLFSIQRDGNGRVDLLPSQASSTIGFEVLNVLEGDRDRVLIYLRMPGSNPSGLYGLNIRTGELSRPIGVPENLDEVFTDEKGIPRFGVLLTPGRNVQRLYRPAGSDEWNKLLGSTRELEVFKPVSIAYSKDIGVVESNLGRDKSGLYKMHFALGQMSTEPVLEDPDYDIHPSPIYSYSGIGFVGLRYEAAKPRQIFFEQSHKDLQGVIDRAVPDAFNVVVSQNGDGSRLVVESISDNRSPGYHFVTIEGLKINPLAKAFPWLDTIPLRGASPVRIQTSKGRVMQGYLTLPKNYSSGGRPVPLIVNPHDGPWARANWGIRSWEDLVPEFYASRGFAVLQVNSRGSGGLGKEHLTAAFKNPAAQHEDIVEAVQWAIREGYADPQKIGIAGTGWGGYIAMNALVKSPDLFRFGISLCGISDLASHIESCSRWASAKSMSLWKSRLGDPGVAVERAQLDAWSPLRNLAQIEDPLFLYAGTAGGNVSVVQSKTMAKEMALLGKPFRFANPSNALSSAFAEENRIDLYKQIETFLAQVTAGW